jgi:hypothetical protein
MTYWRLISTAVAIAAFTVVVSSQTRSGNAVFEQALAKERVEGNLPEAIRLYERVVAEFAADLGRPADAGDRDVRARHALGQQRVRSLLCR